MLKIGATITDFLTKVGIEGDGKDIRHCVVKTDNLESNPKEGDQILVFQTFEGIKF